VKDPPSFRKIEARFENRSPSSVCVFIRISVTGLLFSNIEIHNEYLSSRWRFEMRGTDFWDDALERTSADSIKLLFTLNRILKVLLVLLFAALVASNGFTYWKIQELSKDSSEQVKKTERISQAIDQYDFEDEIAGIDSRVSELKSSLTNLESSVKNYESRSKEDQSKTEQNSNSIATMKGDLDDLRARVSRLETKL
jgi:hypothetical protein